LHIFGVDSDLDRVFKALADPSRRQLLDRLHQNNGQTLGELCEHVDMTRQGAAKHLALLEEANLVVTIWRGREKLHYLNPVPIGAIAERWIDKFERRRLRALHDLKQQLERDHAEAAVRLRHLHRHHAGKALERAARR
jgi:DNA-binding transcriptional ArsR family regulator